MVLGFLLPLLWLVIGILRLRKLDRNDLKGTLKKRAQQKLKAAKKKLIENDYRSAGVEMTNAVLSVLGEASGTGGVSKTADELLTLIPQASATLKERTQSLLSQCELMSFAPEEMALKNQDQKILTDAEKIIEEYLKLLEKKSENASTERKS